MKFPKGIKKNFHIIALITCVVAFPYSLEIPGKAIHNLSEALKNFQIEKSVQPLSAPYSQGVDNQIHPNPHTQKSATNLWHARLNSHG